MEEKEPAYERLQKARSAFIRSCKKMKIQPAFDLATEEGLALAKDGETEMCVDLAQLILRKNIEENFPPRAPEVERLMNLFKAVHEKEKNNRNSNHPMWDLINQILSWIQMNDKTISNEDTQKAWFSVHEQAGIARFKDKEFGAAQGHLLWMASGAKMAQVVQEWSEEVDESERDLLILRTALILLSTDVSRATEFVEYFKFDFEAPVVPAAHQMLFLILQSCIEKNFQFFNHVKTKYQLVTRRDPSLSMLLSKIQENLFGVAEKQNTMSMLMNMFGGGPSN